MYPLPKPRTQTPCRVLPFPHPRATRANSCYTRVYKLFRRNAGVTAWSGRGITLRDKLARHGPTVRARLAPVVRSSFRMLLATAAHDQNQNLYIHARASAARFSDNVTTQGERFRKAPRGASGSAASLMAADVDGCRAMDAPKRPRRRPGAGTPGRGAGCCWRPKIEGRRMHSSGCEVQPEKKNSKKIAGTIDFWYILVYICIYQGNQALEYLRSIT